METRFFIGAHHREIQNGSSGAVLEAAEPRLLRFACTKKTPETSPKRDKPSPKQPGAASALPYGPAARAHNAREAELPEKAIGGRSIGVGEPAWSALRLPRKGWVQKSTERDAVPSSWGRSRQGLRVPGHGRAAAADRKSVV